ncbi:MAG: serine hydrolase domain-containing protein [Nannocystaceae bacterium]|nr:beta-lactamase family protein [bacterium]
MTRVSLLLFTLLLAAGCKPPRTTTTPEPASSGPKTVAADIDITMKGAGNTPRTPQGLEVLLDEVRERSSVPGIAAAVVDGDGVLAIGASGVRRADEPAALTVKDTFHLGSDTKAMTALLVALLVEEGTLGWDMTMQDAFRDEAAAISADFREVTLTQLLRHRAGVATDLAHLEPGLVLRLEPMAPEQRRMAVAMEALAQPPRSTPGSKFEYSNFGYVVVGAVIERATGNTWEAEMKARIFDPLGMASCGFGPTAVGDARDQPWAHADRGDSFAPVEFDNPAFFGPGATVHCNLEDWGKFAAVFFEGANFVSADSMDRLTSPVPNSDNRGGGYALGWAVPDDDAFGLPVLTHDGSNTFNYASIIVMPTLGAAVLVAVNAGGQRAQDAAVATALELARRTRGPRDDPPPG